MSTKKTFRIKLDTEFTIDFEDWGFTDAQQIKLESFKGLIIDEFINERGYDEIDVSENKPISLLETMNQMFNPNNK